MTTPKPLVQVRGLTYHYPDGTPALRGIDFDLAEGESVALFGRNGSGKTTFALHLNGLLQPSSGTITVNGLTPSGKNLSAVRRMVGMVFQDADDQLFMPSILDDVAFGPRNMGASKEQAEARAREVLRELGMAHGFDRAPWHLSLGEKRRVALAGVLAMRPALLVLDEPTTFLDPPGRSELAASLNRLPLARIIVTHDTTFARNTTTRALFFEKGLVTDDGPVDEVIRRNGWDS